jgi:16S rRNA processing protein RimM
VIRKARGLRGEVLAEPFGSKPERFTTGLRVFLAQAGSNEPGREARIESSWLHDGRLVLKFAGVDTRNDSEALRGLEVRIPLEERPPAPKGEYYFSDLVGCRVDALDGRVIGEVTGYHDFGAAPLLEVRSGKREILVPFVEGIYKEIDLAGHRIVVDLPEGLEDL